jgi:hypothetical protein
MDLQPLRTKFEWLKPDALITASSSVPLPSAQLETTPPGDNRQVALPLNKWLLCQKYRALCSQRDDVAARMSLVQDKAVRPLLQADAQVTLRLSADATIASGQHAAEEEQAVSVTQYHSENVWLQRRCRCFHRAAGAAADCVGCNEGRHQMRDKS